MPFRSVTSCLLLILAVYLGGAVGCSSPSADNTASDDDVRAAVRAPLQALRDGHPDKALGLLTGHPVDAAAWKRTEKTLTTHFRRRAQLDAKTCADNLKQLSDAIELYRADETNGYRLPEKLSDLLRSNLKAIPTCPACGKDTYSAGYKSNRRGETFTLVCKGHNHAAAGLRDDSPSFAPRFGVQMNTEDNYAWWPADYHADIETVDRVGSRATVKIKETGNANTEFRLRLRKETSGDQAVWRLDSDRFADEGGSKLGLLLDTYFTAMASPAPVAATNRADCEKSMHRVATALEMYSSDHRGRYPGRLEDLVPQYLPSIPVCSGERGDAQPTYHVSSSNHMYELMCAGQHPDVRMSNRPEGNRATGARMGAILSRQPH